MSNNTAPGGGGGGGSSSDLQEKMNCAEVTGCEAVWPCAFGAPRCPVGNLNICQPSGGREKKKKQVLNTVEYYTV